MWWQVEQKVGLSGGSGRDALLQRKLADNINFLSRNHIGTPQHSSSLFWLLANFVVSNQAAKITVSIELPNVERVSHFPAFYLHCPRHYTVTHHENVITPTPPQLLLIATDKSSIWHVHDTWPHFNQTTVVLNHNAINMPHSALHM